MAIVNKIDCNFDFEKIDNDFDIFVFQTSNKFISKWDTILDSPIYNLNAKSVVFENGRNLYVLFNKNKISRYEIVEKGIPENTSIKKVYSNEIEEHILFKLFLFSLNNPTEELSFNNLSGKLFLYNSSWIKKNRKGFKALSINVDKDMFIKAEATTFTNENLFNDKVRNDPKTTKYTFSIRNCLKKVIDDSDKCEKFIKHPLYNTKAEIPYIDLNAQKIKETKIYYIYYALKMIRNIYGKYISFELANINLVNTIGDFKDDDFDAKAKEILSSKKINFINYVIEPEYLDLFEEIKTNILNNLKGINAKTSNEIDTNYINICFAHNKEYYIDNNVNDPYTDAHKNVVVQFVTVEDSLDKIIHNNEAVINTIFKEMVIKDEIINLGKISLDEWQAFGFNDTYTFGREKNGHLYMMSVSPDGHFAFDHKNDDFINFKNSKFAKCANVLSASNEKEKIVVMDSESNIILISRTGYFCIPDLEIFALDKISRSNEAREKYLSGIIDVNLFEIDGNTYFNAGIKGKGMNTAIPKASILYKSEVIKGRNIISDILSTMSVSFVKYKSFTVLPYPFKYLNEYIEMVENN